MLYQQLPFSRTWWLCGFLTILYTSVICAQPAQEIDSWQNENLAEATRLQLLDSLARKVYWAKQPDSAFFCLDQMLAIATEGEHATYLRLGLRRRAQLYARIGDYQSAIPANEERIAAYEAATYDQNKRYRALSESHRNLGYALRKVGRTADALQQYQRSLYYAETIGDEGLRSKASTLNSLGNLYLNLEEYKLAIEKYQTSLDIFQTIDYKMGIYSALNNLGLASAKTDNYSKAIEYYEISLQMKKEAGDKKRMANTYGNIGDIYLAWEHEEEARQYFLQAKELQEELGLRDELARSITQLGNLSRIQGKSEEAVKWCTQSCLIAEDDDLWQAQIACHQCLFEAQKMLGNYELALQEHESYIAIKDSIFSAENTQEIAQFEARLTYEKQLAEAQTEQLQLESQAKQERLLRWIFVGASLALALLSWLAIRIGRLRQRQNEVLQEKNTQIEADRKLIRQQADALEESAVMKNNFFANISHELRTPLTLVISPLEQLMKAGSSLPTKVAATLGTVKGNANKLLNLVEELLELSQLEAGTIKVEERPLAVLPFVQQIFENYQLLAQEKRIQYDFAHNEHLGLRIQADPRLLQKIIDNLLNNALKFTPDGGQVNLEITIENTDDHTLQIVVSDSGPGIAEADIASIFDRYHQLAKQADNATTGMGIGLALAQESAKLLNGHLTVSSTIDLGSVFIFKMPIRLTEPETAISPLPDTTNVLQAAGFATSRRILIVEDNKELQEFIAEVLSGYDCSLAGNGKEALQMLYEARRKENPYELVITDLMMPEMDGTSLIEHIKGDSDLLASRLIVLTARHNLTEKLALLRIGVDDYLNKPFSPEELAVRVANLLKHPIQHEPLFESITGEENNGQAWLTEAEELVKQLLQARQKLSAGILASRLNLSNRQLLRKIRAATGLSTQLYLQECKLQLAQQYLAEQQFSGISEVAKSCGFSTPAYFSKVFRERFGKNPGDYFQ